MKPHKHAKLIKAWADGARIQYWTGVDWFDCINNEPSWNDENQFRIKPESKADDAYFYAFRSPTDVGNMTTSNYGECNLKLIWKHGKLIDAEVLK